MNFKRRHKIKYKQTPHCSSSASCSVHSVVSVAPVSISAASSKFVSVICFSVVVVVVAAAAYFFSSTFLARFMLTHFSWQYVRCRRRSCAVQAAAEAQWAAVEVKALLCTWTVIMVSFCAHWAQCATQKVIN